MICQGRGGRGGAQPQDTFTAVPPYGLREIRIIMDAWCHFHRPRNLGGDCTADKRLYTVRPETGNGDCTPSCACACIQE